LDTRRQMAALLQVWVIVIPLQCSDSSMLRFAWFWRSASRREWPATSDLSSGRIAGVIRSKLRQYSMPPSDASSRVHKWGRQKVGIYSQMERGLGAMVDRFGLVRSSLEFGLTAEQIRGGNPKGQDSRQGWVRVWIISSN
jgi:hypothetical protein